MVVCLLLSCQRELQNGKGYEDSRKEPAYVPKVIDGAEENPERD